MNAVEYLDFYIEVTGQAAPAYQIAVRSKAGEARTATTFPYTNAELEAELQRLENAILYAQVGTRSRLPPQEAAVRDFGARFFDFLLPPGETRSLYYECRRLAEFESKGVRLNLLIQPPHLAALPWEFLHDPRRRDYIALDPHTPLVRYPEVAQSVAPLPVTPPLRILGLVANPTDLPRLDMEAEQQQVMTALQPLLDRGLVEVTWLPGQGWRELQQWMRPGYGPWHIFHFIGHGSFDPKRDEGRIFLADEQGQAQAISATQLSRLLAFQRGTLRLAILNACEGARGGKFDALSSTAATLVLDGLPAVLAMQYAITDNAALEFARTFYSALSDNLPVDAAVAEARNAINLQNNASLEWGTPVLTMRSQDGQLFDLAKDETKQVLPSPPAATPSLLVAPLPSAQEKSSTWRLSRLWAFMLLFMIVVLSIQFRPQITGWLGINATTYVTPTPLHPDPTTGTPVAVKPTGTNTILAIPPPSLTVPAVTPSELVYQTPTAQASVLFATANEEECTTWRRLIDNQRYDDLAAEMKSSTIKPFRELPVIVTDTLKLSAIVTEVACADPQPTAQASVLFATASQEECTAWHSLIAKGRYDDLATEVKSSTIKPFRELPVIVTDTLKLSAIITEVLCADPQP